MIELLVTITIAAILTGLAAPAFQEFRIRNQSAAMANELTSTVLRSRNEAINRNACVIVCRSTTAAGANPSCGTGSNWRTGWIAFVDETCAGSANTPVRPELLIAATGPFNSNFSLTKTGATGANLSRVVFFPQGNARVSDVGSFNLRYQTSTRDSNRSICLNAQGRTRVVPFATSCL